MEGIGSRATVFELEGFGGEKHQYVQWLLNEAVAPKTKARRFERSTGDPASVRAVPHAGVGRALEEGYKVGQKPVGTEVIDTVLATDLNALEPRLTRQGYNE